MLCYCFGYSRSVNSSTEYEQDHGSTTGSAGTLGLAPDMQEALKGRPLPPTGYVDCGRNF